MSAQKKDQIPLRNVKYLLILNAPTTGDAAMEFVIFRILLHVMKKNGKLLLQAANALNLNIQKNSKCVKK